MGRLGNTLPKNIPISLIFLLGVNRSITKTIINQAIKISITNQIICSLITSIFFICNSKITSGKISSGTRPK